MTEEEWQAKFKAYPNRADPKKIDRLISAELGLRQVFWCWIVNDPFFVEWHGTDRRHCPWCKDIDEEGMDDYHTFMFSVCKPTEEYRLPYPEG